MNYKNRMFVLISGALAIIIAFGSYVFGVTPLVELTSNTETELIQQRSTLAIEQAKLEALSNTQNIDDIEARVTTLTKAIPLQLSDTTFYTTVNALREQTGATVAAITVGAGAGGVGAPAEGAAPAASGSKPYGVTIQGAGTRSEVLGFIDALQNAERLIRIDSVDFAGAEGEYTFNVTGEIYSLVLPESIVAPSEEAVPATDAEVPSP
jgi:hypothetical protein